MVILNLTVIASWVSIVVLCSICVTVVNLNW